MNNKEEKTVFVHNITIEGEEALITIQSTSKEFCEKFNNAISEASPHQTVWSHIGTSKDKPCVRNYPLKRYQRS